MTTASFDFAEFARSGQLGRVGIGSSRELVRSELGDPDDWVPCGKDGTLKVEARAYEYGLFHVFFEGPTVSGLGLYYTLEDHYGLPSQFVLREALPRGPEWDVFKEWLSSYDLLSGSTERSSPRSRSGEREIVLASGVVVFGRDRVICVRHFKNE